MKTTNGFICFILAVFFITGCKPNPAPEVLWREDGTVMDANGNLTTLELQSLYDGVSFKGDTYVIGFKIEKGGINIPYIAGVSAGLSTISYWPFEAVINDIFIYKNAVHVNAFDGKVFVLKDALWEVADFVLPEYSQVVHTDGKEALVVCHSAPKPINDNDRGCYSVAPVWNFNFAWLTVVPKICDGALFTFDEKPEDGIFRALSLETGEVLFSRVLTHPPWDICAVEAKQWWEFGL